MSSNRMVLVLVAATMSVGVAVVACSSGTTGTGTGDGGTGTGTSGTGTSGTGTSGAATSGGGGGGAIGGSKCGTSGGTSTCTAADYEPYNSCLTSMCDAEYKAALGDGYASGSYGGACGTYINCINACACSDTACYQKCGMPTSACSTALTSVSTCTKKCTAPACATASTSGGTSGTSGASGTSGGTTHTCADLSACCAKITDPNYKSSCTQTETSLMGNDTNCNAVYPSYAAMCP